MNKIDAAAHAVVAWVRAEVARVIVEAEKAGEDVVMAVKNLLGHQGDGAAHEALKAGAVQAAINSAVPSQPASAVRTVVAPAAPEQEPSVTSAEPPVQAPGEGGDASQQAPADPAADAGAANSGEKPQADEGAQLSGEEINRRVDDALAKSGLVGMAEASGAINSAEATTDAGDGDAAAATATATEADLKSLGSAESNAAPAAPEDSGGIIGRGI